VADPHSRFEPGLDYPGRARKPAGESDGVERASWISSPSGRYSPHNALPTPSHKWPRHSYSTGYLSIRTLDPLVVTQEFTMPAKSLIRIRNGELVGEAELRTAELGTEITLLVLVID
jgi:hypothetical protein